MAIRTTDGTQYKRIPNVGDMYPTATGFQREVATYTATGGESSINLALLSTPLSYMPGRNQLSIKRSSGGALMVGLDFTETSSTTVGFSDPLIAGEVVEITKEFTVTGVMAVEPRPDCYTAVATAGQTLVTADFSWTYNAFASKGVGAVRVYLHGVLQVRGTDYTEVNLGGTMTNSITFVDALLGGENIVILPTQQVIDDAGASTQFNNSRVTGLQNLLSVGAQNFVDQSSDMIAVPNTSIVGRAKIPNLANDLRMSLGNERVAVQSIVQLQNEFGLNGEPVFAALNDDRGLIRFVGSWQINNNAAGLVAATSATDSYMEVVFYGTGVNLLMTLFSSHSYTYSLDGGANTSFINATYPGTLNNRNYNQNTVVNVVTTSLGLHTLKINGGANFQINGLEVRNENASGLVNVNPGTAYIGGLKVVKPSVSSVAYNTGVTGTRGGRIVRYLNSDGTVGQAFTPTNAAAAYLAAADHTNEEVARPYHFREFGAGRADDFSLPVATPGGTGTTPKAFTLDDGTTTLVAGGANASFFLAPSGMECIYCNAANDFITFTFVGTGVDIFTVRSGATDAHTITIDGVNIGSVSSSVIGMVKLASGLAYGTHTVKITRTATLANALCISKFIVYQPKKPAIPASALELCDYNVMGDFASCNAGDTTVASGVLRKSVTREMVYVGTGWGVFATPVASGFMTNTTVNNDYMQYTFFGTGFSYRFQNTSVSAVTAQMTLTDAANPAGTTNFSAFTVATNGTGISSFTASTATLVTTTAGTDGNVISVSGLALGWHTIKITRTAGGSVNFYQQALDIITPIHSYKSNLYADLQNTLPVGSQSLMDSRKTSMIKEALPAQKAWAQAIGIATGPTTNSFSGVPIPDMSVTIKTNGGPIQISYSVCGHTASTGSPIYIAPYVDGVISQGAIWMVISGDHSTAATASGISNTFVTPLSAGVHKVDLYWCTDSSIIATAVGVRRTLTVQEL